MEEVSAPLDPANRPAGTECDEEPLTEEDLQAISEAKAAIARGEFTTLDGLERRLDAADRKHG